MESAFRTRSMTASCHPVIELNVGAAGMDSEAARRLRELSHDLRQPLAAIGALAEAAANVVVDPTTPADVVLCCLERISDETHQLLQLCRHVLDHLSTVEPVPVHVVATEVVERTRPAATCRLEVHATPCVIRTDPVELRRMLANLVDNAQRAAGAGGTVEVVVGVDGEHISIEVGDSGSGFGCVPVGAAGLGFVVLERFAARHGGRVEIGTSRLGGALVACVIPAREGEESPGLELSPEGCP